jgi:hypothetical protein
VRRQLPRSYCLLFFSPILWHSSIYSQNAFQWYCYFLQSTIQPWQDCTIPTLRL